MIDRGLVLSPWDEEHRKKVITIIVEELEKPSIAAAYSIKAVMTVCYITALSLIILNFVKQ